MVRFALIFALVLVATETSPAVACPSAPARPQMDATAAPILVVPEMAPPLRALLVEPGRPQAGRIPGAMPA